MGRREHGRGPQPARPSSRRARDPCLHADAKGGSAAGHDTLRQHMVAMEKNSNRAKWAKLKMNTAETEWRGRGAGPAAAAALCTNPALPQPAAPPTCLAHGGHFLECRRRAGGEHTRACTLDGAGRAPCGLPCGLPIERKAKGGLKRAQAAQMTCRSFAAQLAEKNARAKPACIRSACFGLKQQTPRSRHGGIQGRR